MWRCSGIRTMTSPYVTTAILDTIRGAGFHVGWTSTVDVRTGELRRVVNAVDAKTGGKRSAVCNGLLGQRW